MADKLHFEFRDLSCVPIRLEREQAQNEIIVLGQLKSPIFAGRPDLGGHILNNFRLPAMKPVPADADIVSNRMGKAAVESREIDADDHVRLALDGQTTELVENAA